MKSRVSNIATVVIFLLFVSLLLLVFALHAKAATLPAELSKNIIKNMAVGEVGYNTPAVMVVDESGNCYLQGKLSNEVDKAAEMKHGWIRIERKKEGFYIYIIKSDKTLWVGEHIPYLQDKLERGDLVRVKSIIIIK